MADALPPRRLILASSSRYRRELLERLRVPFEVVVPGSDETPLAGETPAQTAERLAQTKARDVARNASRCANHRFGPGCHDRWTAVGQTGPSRGGTSATSEHARRTVEFHSALCLFDARTGIVRSTDVITQVRFRNLPDAALQAYLHAEQPYDVAGSAKSEGLGNRPARSRTLRRSDSTGRPTSNCVDRNAG